MEKKKITIDDIAKEIGCSKATVSRAISGKGRIGKETRERILNYIEEVDYKPNVIAKSLAQSKTFNIGVVLPDDHDLNEIPFFQNCLLGICEMAAGSDYDVVVTTVGMNDISRLVRIVQNHKVDGIILTRSLLHDASVQYLKKCHVPFVVVGSSEDNEVVQVDHHHVEACKELTSILIMQGMRHLAFIGGNSEHTVSRKRYEGFVEGCGKYLVPVKPELVFLNSNTRVLVDKAVNSILNQRVDCIVCMDDKICSQVLLKLNQEGVSVPKEMKVASFYNNFYLESNKPPITAVKMDEKGLGMASCRVLLDMMERKEVPHKTLMGYEISLKDSTKQDKSYYTK